MRVFNRLASVVLGVVLAALGVLIAAEAIMLLRGSAPVLIPLSDWYQALRATTFADQIVMAVAIGLIVLGAIAVLAQLMPRRPVRLPLAVGQDWYAHRRSLEHGVASAVDRIHGVSNARASVTKHWRCRVTATGDRDSRPDVDEAITAELRRMSAPAERDVRVNLVRSRRVT